VAFASIKMASSTIRDLRDLVRQRDSLPDINGDGGRSSFCRYGPLDLTSPDQYWTFSDGRREEYCPRNICPGCYVFDNGDSYSRLASDIGKAVWLLFPGILMWVLSPMVIDYFNGCTRARSLGISHSGKILVTHSHAIISFSLVIYVPITSVCILTRQPFL
jgi:hypothetical protein